MQAELAESIRGNLLTQALIVVLCVTFSSNRLQQTQDLAELEKLYVTHRLLTTTAGDVRHDDNDAGETAQSKQSSATETTFTSDASALEADSLAVFLAKTKTGDDPPVHRVPLPSGGWLRFQASRDSYQELAPPESGSHVPLYQLSIGVSASSDLHHQGPLTTRLTNAEQSRSPATGALVWEPMKLRAFADHHAEPFAAVDIENRIRLKAQAWGQATDSVDSLYAASRYAYENEQISVPMVNINVSASLALVALALVSTALSAHASYQCRTAGVKEESAGGHSLLILRPIGGTVPPGWWHQVVAQAEVLFIQPPYWLGLLSPVICSLMLGVIHSDVEGWWLGWVLLPFAAAYTWLLGRAIVGSSWKHA
ncbi:hypothetical protein [Prosthecobacter sp.]|uniref:hypothetical protein n=1 Tax=Prosthecobacter sp. TaxID=1965333 RepID=UPI001D31AFFA|nr:hypothetical protein [Prosthecobacter sp.]MCB1275809.1 hypothetical protein [Prosthecobacter sp.]